MNRKVYMDYAATTFIRKEVLTEMIPYLDHFYGNPSGIHELARISKNAIEKSRELISTFLDCNKKEIFFTSGGTESNNWAIKGVAFSNVDKGNHIITTKIEHHSVLYTCRYLEKRGFNITYLDVDREGMVDVDLLKRSINNNTILVTIAFANNEIGTIQDIDSISKVCKERDVIFHTDAIQAIGRVDIGLEKYKCIDLLSVSGHKIYSPKGIGLLYVRQGTKIENYFHGGSQEKGKRSGTENVYGIVGLGKAIEVVCSELSYEGSRLTNLRDYMIDRILNEISGSKINGSRQNRLNNNINVCFDGLDDEGILLSLDLKGIFASSGSSCNSGSVNSSHVLQSIGLSDNEAKSSVRFTIGKYTSKEEIDYVIDQLKQIVDRHRKC